MGIFKAYDIRGLYPEEINEEIMEKIGKAFAKFVDGKNIAAGYDMRVSSKSLFDSFIKGVISQGKNVIDFGLTSTPMSYFACNHLKADGCAMITASHNPKEYNGVKFTGKNAKPISESTGILEIKNLAEEDNFIDASRKGEVISQDVLPEYKKHLSKFVEDTGGLKVVVDCANGMGSQDFSLIEDETDSQVTKMYFDIDGTFPNHDANPMKEGVLDDLKKKVLSTNSDLGIAFDGDADRVFFVDDTGELVASDYITALISEEILKHHEGSTILYDLRSSWIVPEMIEKFGGVPKMSRVGHSFIKEMMKNEESPFAGELSGHFYFRFDFDEDMSMYDSGIVTAILVMNLLSSKKRKLSELVSPMKKYFATGEINSKVDDKEAKMDELAEKYKDGTISWLDGIRVDYADWWFNVRPSNTEPYLRLNLEARSDQLMKEKREEVLKIIRK